MARLALAFAVIDHAAGILVAQVVDQNGDRSRIRFAMTYTAHE